jgi:hypothetical protein
VSVKRENFFIASGNIASGTLALQSSFISPLFLQSRQRRYILESEDERGEGETIYRWCFDNFFSLRVFGCGVCLLASRREN